MSRRKFDDLAGGSESTLGVAFRAVSIGNIPDSACDGKMQLLKTTPGVLPGDTIYVSFGNSVPSPTSYHVKLTDTFPAWDMDGIIPGQIQAMGTKATSAVQLFAPYSTK